MSMPGAQPDDPTTDLRAQLIEKILIKQDDAGRWGYDEKQARERPEYVHYSPNYRSTLWTLVLLADLQAPPDLPQAHAALELITAHFWDAENGIFGFPNRSHFPIPCLNGNMLYLHGYFDNGDERLARTVDFFAAHQRFDDGDFRTPKAHPYCGNRSCYGAHTCFWGAAKLLKGLSFTPRERRTPAAQGLLERCIDFVLLHEVCFSSRRPE
ncbi:MAG: hypothetical protein HPY76_09420, partial [Anaerolineae bacterium]|nr:hypothetical protein [Anaerolineae bacterium]